MRWRTTRQCWRFLSLSDRARARLLEMDWPAPITAMDVSEDEGCEMIYYLQSHGFKVVFEKLTRTKKRRQRKAA